MKVSVVAASALASMPVIVQLPFESAVAGYALVVVVPSVTVNEIVSPAPVVPLAETFVSFEASTTGVTLVNVIVGGVTFFTPGSVTVVGMPAKVAVAEKVMAPSFKPVASMPVTVHFPSAPNVAG